MSKCISKKEMEMLKKIHQNKVEVSENRKAIAEELTKEYSDILPRIENYLSDISGMNIKVKMGIVPFGRTSEEKGFKIIFPDNSLVESYTPVTIDFVKTLLDKNSSLTIEQAVLMGIFDCLVNGEGIASVISPDDLTNGQEVCTCNICRFDAQMALKQEREENNYDK